MSLIRVLTTILLFATPTWADFPSPPRTDDSDAPQGTRYLDVYPHDLKLSCAKHLVQMTVATRHGGNFISWVEDGSPYMILVRDSMFQLRSLEQLNKGMQLGVWSKPVQGATIHPKSGWVAVGLDEGNVHLLPMGKSSDVRELKGASPTAHKAEVRCLAFNSGGTLLATFSYAGDGALHKRSGETWKTIGTFKSIGATPSKVQFSPDGKWLVVEARGGGLFSYAVDNLKSKPAGGEYLPAQTVRPEDESHAPLLSRFFVGRGHKMVYNYNHSRLGSFFFIVDIAKGTWSPKYPGTALHELHRASNHRQPELIVAVGAEQRNAELWLWQNSPKERILKSQPLDIAFPFPIGGLGAPVHGQAGNRSLNKVFPTSIGSTEDGDTLLTGDNAGVVRIFERTETGFEEKASIALFPRYHRGTRMMTAMQSVTRIWRYGARTFFAASDEHEIVRIDLDSIFASP